MKLSHVSMKTKKELHDQSLRPVYTGDFCGDFSHSDACDWVVESQKYWFI